MVLVSVVVFVEPLTLVWVAVVVVVPDDVSVVVQAGCVRGSLKHMSQLPSPSVS